MNQTGKTRRFYIKGRASLNGMRPAGYPSRYVFDNMIQKFYIISILIIELFCFSLVADIYAEDGIRTQRMI